jgi:hypothetical protein
MNNGRVQGHLGTSTCSLCRRGKHNVIAASHKYTITCPSSYNNLVLQAMVAAGTIRVNESGTQ